MSVFISIPVLAYNHENFIGNTIDNILAQDVKYSYEIIVGEDCSKDKTREIVLSYIKKYPDKIKIITSNENVGAIENSKRIIAECNGKYLAFCEGDDFWTDPFKLQKQIDFLESNPDFGMIHTDVNHLYQNKNKLIKDINKSNGIDFPSGNIFNDYLKGDLFIKTASVVVKRELFIDACNYNLFKSKGWVLQDLPTWLEIANKTKIKYLPESTATYRLIDESASRSANPTKTHNFHLAVFNTRYYFWSKYSNDPNIKRNIDIAFCKMMMGDAYKGKDRHLAVNAKTFFLKYNIKMSFKTIIKYYLIFVSPFFKKII